jgi:hypothetical protein
MIFRKEIIAILALTSLSLVGCSSSSNSNSDGGVVGAQFNGNWAQACEVEGDPANANAEYSTITGSLNGSSATYVTTYYEDMNCTVPVEDEQVVTITASLVYPGGTTTTALGEATHVDITTTGIRYDGVEPSAEERAQLEAAGFFDTEYDLILELNNQLYFGDYTANFAGRTPETRPIEIEANPLFMRQ